MSPYTLPNGNVQISFSGGRTSGYMLHAIMEANGGLPERARVVFANTGRERNETLDFVQEICIEIDPALREHKRALEILESKSFYLVNKENTPRSWNREFSNCLLRKRGFSD